MRPNNQNRRGRGRGPRKPHGGPHGHGGGQPSKAHSFDSSGPDIRVRGNAYQVLEKYLQLARDAGTAGDRVAAENFLQHADHYYRVVAAQSEGQRPRIGGREVSVADINVNNGQGLSAAMSGHGHSSGDEQQHSAENQQGGQGNGQMRPNQNSGDPHNQHPQHQNQNPQGQHAAESQNADGEDSDSNGDGGDAAPDEQPEYPEELLPADGANAAPRDGQQQEGRHHGRGRGRRRGPGRRVRSEGEESAPTPAPVPPSGETQ
jgi:hypothetical protein